MTLIEIMIVIAILGLIAGVIGVAVIDQLERARRQAAHTQIDSFRSALVLFNSDCGRYPTAAEGLDALVQKPANCPQWKRQFAENRIPLDPWGNAYEYVVPGPNGRDVDVVSKGQDGELHTADDIPMTQVAIR